LSPLYDSTCPGYEQAYFDQQCSLDGLYDRSCPNYAEAYAKQNLLSQNDQTTNIVTAPIASTTEPTVQIKDDGKVSTEVQIVSDSAVNDVITKKTEVKAEAPAPAAQPTQTQTQATAQSTQTQTAQQTEKKQEQKKTDTEIAKIEKKSESKDTKSSSKSKEDAKKEATEKAKELANDMSKAATLEAQAANQGVVLGLMNYVPGFSAYQNSIVPDTNAISMNKQYNKNNVDNRRAIRALSGASDRLHEQMVREQYQ
jgi:outer membrane biosynthesis protein TonB